MDGYKYDKNLKPLVSDVSTLGITQRSVMLLFDEMQRSPQNIEYVVHCSFMQIYKEKIHDLLNPSGRGLKIRWTKQDQFYVEHLAVKPCRSPQEVLEYFHTGLKNKVIGSHNLNKTSSRSHSILTLVVEAIDSEEGTICTSKLQLVDLAGSERIAVTGNEGKGMQESIKINKSLFTLRQVITTLSGKEPEGFIPYRDSKLTSLLKQSIGGNSYCLMVACLAPADAYYEENLSTLTYASQTSHISNAPTKNIDPKTKVVNGLKEEIKKLKKELNDSLEHIDMLTELLSLDSSQQHERLSQYEKLKNKSSHINRIKAIRASLASRTSIDERKKPIKEEGGEFLNAEILSEKLHDSVKMIKDLMNSNRKLKETINQLTKIKKNYEGELSYIQSENQNLQERLDNVEGTGNKDVSEIHKLRREKEELEKRILLMDRESKQISSVFSENKKSALRTRNDYSESPAPHQPIVMLHDRADSVILSKRKSRGKKNYESQKNRKVDHLIKDEAINTLSDMLINRARRYV